MPNFFINVKEKGAKKAEKNIRGLNASLGGLASKAALAAGSFFGANMLLSGMRQAIKLAGEQEAAEKALETALGGTSRALLDQASALQEISVFGDEAIIRQQAFLGSLKFTEDQIRSIIPVAMDLAAATGMTLESAVRNTAKTFSGLAGELGELVPQLRGLTKEQMMAGDAVTVMGDLFGGQATSQVETMSGKLEQMENAAGDTMEALGNLASKAVIPLSGHLKTAAENATIFINSLAEDNDDIEKNTITAERNSLVYESLGNAYDLLSSKIGEYMVSSSPFRQHQADLIQQSEDYKQSIMGQIEQLDRINESELRRSDNKTNYLEIIKKSEKIEVESATLAQKTAIMKEAAIKAELKGYAMTSGSAEDAMKNVVKAESMEAVAGLISSILRTVPFPLSAVLAAGAGATASNLIDKGLANFATGADFVTSGPQMMMVGDNPSGQERVQVTPLGGDPNINGPQGGGSVVVNVSGNVMSQDYVEGELAEQIKEAIRRGNDFGIG